MRKVITTLIIATSLIASGCANNTDTKLILRGTQAPAPQIETFNLGIEKPKVTLEKTSIILASNTNSITPELAGRITKVNVKNGQKVSKGQTLFILGDSLSTDIQNEQNKSLEEGLYISEQSKNLTYQTTNNTLKSLEIALDIAKENLRNANKAIDKDENDQTKNAQFMAQKQYQGARNQLEQAEASQELQLLQAQNQENQIILNSNITKLNQEKRYIKAQISGTITSITAKKGNLVGPGQVLAQISNDKNQIIKVSLNKKEISYIKENDTVKITDGKNETRGKIVSINNILDQITLKHVVEIEVDQNNLTTGDTITVIFTPRIAELLIPLNAVQLEDGEKTVQILKDEEIVRTPITTKNIFGNFIEVTSGLNGTEQVVVSYSNNL